VIIRSPKELGGFLKDLRRNARLSQTELATRTNVSQKWISAVENGKPTAEVGMVLRLLQALGAELDLHPPAQELSRPSNAAERPTLNHPGDLDKVLGRLRNQA
jgi:HTH-type transcriptional regulator / antitoxin HipB